MKQRILVLEDDRTSRKLIAIVLEKAGYDVIECVEGRDAIHLALMNPPKAIIADVMLPDMTGTEVIEELKKHPECKYMKSIFLTGLLSKKSDAAKAKFLFDVDGSQYRALAKPVKKSLLLNLLAEAIVEAEKEALEDAIALKEEQERVAKALAKAKREKAKKKAAEKGETENGSEESTPRDEQEQATVV